MEIGLINYIKEAEKHGLSEKQTKQNLLQKSNFEKWLEYFFYN